MAPSRARVLKALTVIQHGSATFLSVFLTVHLAAPAVAVLGGSQLSSQVLLLGREYYQSRITEPLLVFAPLGIHIVAAGIKRALIGPPKRPSTLTSTGWLLALFLVPKHIMLHRIHPSSPDPPVSSLGPAQLDFEFVKVGLAVWPVLSWTLYTTLVVATIFHAVEGGAHMLQYWQRRLAAKASSEADSPARPQDRRRQKARSAFVQNTIISAGISSVLGGLAIIASEPLNISRTFMSRIEASFMSDSMFQRWARR